MRTHIGGDVPLRDAEWDPNSDVDRLAKRVLDRLRTRDALTAARHANGWTTPKEVARVAAEVFLDDNARGPAGTPGVAWAGP